MPTLFCGGSVLNVVHVGSAAAASCPAAGQKLAKTGRQNACVQPSCRHQPPPAPSAAPLAREAAGRASLGPLRHDDAVPVAPAHSSRTAEHPRPPEARSTCLPKEHREQGGLPLCRPLCCCALCPQPQAALDRPAAITSAPKSPHHAPGAPPTKQATGPSPLPSPPHAQFSGGNTNLRGENRGKAQTQEGPGLTCGGRGP